MGLRRKISLWFAGVLAALALAGYVGLSLTLQPAFDGLEDRASREDLARARHGIVARKRVLTTLSTSYAQWDKSYLFMQGLAPDFEAENINPDTLVALDANLFVLYDLAGRSRTGIFIDLQTRDAQSVAAVGLSQTTVDALGNHPSLTSEISGIVQSSFGPMLVSSRPITTIDVTKPTNGTLVFGRLLDNAQIADIANNAEVDITLLPIDGAAPTSPSGDMFGAVVQTLDDGTRTNTQVLHDILGAPAAMLEVRSGRDVTSLGMNAMASALVLFFSLGVLTIIVLSLILNSAIIRPISQLKAKMVEIEEREDDSIRVDLNRADEIGDLAQSVNRTLDKLEDLKDENIDQSFKAGMAEVAAGVLHNLRNTLMAVINNVAMAREAMIRRSDNNVFLAIDEISAPGTDAERRKKLVKFVRNSRKRAVENRATAIEHLGSVLDQLDHATEILKEQEERAHAKPVIESVGLREVIDTALGVVPSDVMSSIAIDVGQIDRNTRVNAHRVSLMQVIGNVLVNAVDSILSNGSSLGRISIDANRSSDGQTVSLIIRDDGTGIEEGQLHRLFDRGYTTKDGSGGLGLHWSANALAGMGAEITASSEGAGHGAEFCITLQATDPGPTVNE